MTSVRKFYGSLGTGTRLPLLAGVALIVLGTAAALWWAMTPRWQLLFGNLEETDAAEIAASLQEWKVPHRYTDDGTAIEVEADRVYDTRMKLVSAGVPSGGHVGFELFDDSDFGATEFAQRVNYQRALQGEIERTIGALPGVESARVHLTIRRPGLFVGEQENSKASVALALTPGTHLDAGQVGGIRNMVAAAVDGLATEAVIVLGPNGELLAGGGDGGDGMQARDQQQGDHESRIRERIQDLLRGVFGLADYTVSVSAQMNFDQVHEVNESLLPHGRSEHGLLVRKQTTRPGLAADGAATGAAQEQVEYAHGSRREEIARAPGRIERLSIAVLVPAGLAKGELDRLRGLVSAAAGLDAKRGDTLEIGTLRDGALEADTPPETTGNLLLDPPRPREPVVVTPTEIALPATWTWGIAAGLFLVGVLLGWWMHPRPRRLSEQEVDAMATRLRAWLADGSATA